MNQVQTDNCKGNILAIDDTPANLRLLVNILTEEGYKVRAVPSGKIALSGLHSSLPDLILLDIMMPEMNGYEVCEQLKASPQTRDIPVIFISAINDVLDKVKAFDVGGVDYVTKPFEAKEVLARVETHLANRRLQKSLQYKNEELTKTLQQLKATQEELIQSEKMAALGQLIAGVAHEVNTPLAAIRSSAENIADFFTEYLEQLPKVLQKLSPERQQDFFALLHNSTQQEISMSTKEERQVRRGLTQELEEQAIENADRLASTLVKLGVYNDIQPFWQLLKAPESQTVINTAYELASAHKSTKTILTATNRAAKIVFALKKYAHYDATGEKVEASISDGIETVLSLYQNQLKQGVTVIRNYQALPSILCYPDELHQVWTNLIYNALQAMNNRGTLTIDITQQESNVIISITDSGKGISQEINQKIFEPFFTTKSLGEGSGLGLYIVKKIIDKHDGKIEVESIPGQTQFTVSLPLNSMKESRYA